MKSRSSSMSGVRSPSCLKESKNSELLDGVCGSLWPSDAAVGCWSEDWAEATVVPVRVTAAAVATATAMVRKERMGSCLLPFGSCGGAERGAPS